MIGWGEGTKRRAGFLLLLAGGVAVASLAPMWLDSEARAAAQGSYCWRAGRTQHNMALWSEDNGRTWR